MNTTEIIEAIKALSVEDRFKLIGHVSGAASTERDYASYGRPYDVAGYDLPADPGPQPTLEETYAATAAKAITPNNVTAENKTEE